MSSLQSFLLILLSMCNSSFLEQQFSVNSNALNITSIHIKLDGSTQCCCFNLSIVFIMGSKRYETSNMKINCNPTTSVSKSFPIVLFVKSENINENETILYKSNVDANVSISVSLQIKSKHADEAHALPLINISETLIVSNPYLNKQLFHKIPKGAEDMELALSVSYEILFDQTTNETQKNQLIYTLYDAIVYVLDKNGFGAQFNNLFVEDTPHEIIYNHQGDMVVKYSQIFDEKDKVKVITLTNSTKFELGLNEYFHTSQLGIAKTATIVVLNNEMKLIYIRTERISIWDSMKGTVSAVAFIVFVVCIVTICAACFHCKKRREDFETTLPKSKMHRKRVDEALKRKALRKKSRSIYAKYKAVRGNTINKVDDSFDVVNQTEPYNDLEMTKMSKQEIS